jgi:hypothetical protein
MPINTVIAGNPDSVAATGTWLQNRLAATVHDTTTATGRARDLARTTWRGPAATAFGDRMDRVCRNGDALATDTTLVAATFGELATALRGAQAQMARARDIATAGGLSVADGIIADPIVPPMCFVDPALEAASVQRHQQMADAYTAARAAAQGAVDLLAGAARALLAIWDGVQRKGYLSAVDFVGKTAQVYAERHVSALTGEAGRLRDEALAAQGRSLEAPAGSADAELHDKIRQQSNVLAAEAQERLRPATAGQAVLAALDKSVTAGQIVVDILHGESPSKSIVTNVTESAAGATAGEMIAGALVARGAGIALAAILTGGTAVVVGAAAGLLAEAAWNAVPQDVRDKIDQGAREVFDAGKKIVTGTWHAAENLAESVWHALF